MGRPHWKLSADRKIVTLSFPDTSDVSINYDAKSMDNLLTNLAVLRSEMLPKHQDKFKRGSRVKAVVNPQYSSESEIIKNDSLLHLRHPGFGWLSFLLSKKHAAHIGGLLQRQAALNPQGSDKKPN